jgi:hypothetical protein
VVVSRKAAAAQAVVPVVEKEAGSALTFWVTFRNAAAHQAQVDRDLGVAGKLALVEEFYLEVCRMNYLNRLKAVLGANVVVTGPVRV